jgi:hypothetical protein
VTDRILPGATPRPARPGLSAFSSDLPSGSGGYGAPPPPPPAEPPGGDEAPPGGGPPPAPAGGLPWENRAQVGFMPALIQTAQMLAMRPREAYDAARRKGDYASPLIWVAIFGALAGLIQWLYSMMFLGPTLAMMPAELREVLGPLIGSGTLAGGVINVFMFPVFALIGAFIWSAILHVCFLMAGGSSQSDAGFEGTFRTVGYAQVAQIAQVVPVVGSLIAVVWNVILLVVGLSSLHHLTTGKAVIVVLIPLFLCCACISIGLALGAAGLIGLAGR